MAIAERTHLFPSRTQKLSSSAPMILGGRLPGKAGRCRFANLCGSMVKRSRHRPFTAVTGVRFPVESPFFYFCAIGGIGRRTRFRFWRATVGVQVPHRAPYGRSGDYSVEDTPVPISNTEVKLSSANDTWWEAAWESRTLPVDICGSGSGVEHRLAKARVASSNLVFRSKTKTTYIM